MTKRSTNGKRAKKPTKTKQPRSVSAPLPLVRAPRQRMDLQRITHAVCAISDPFCAAANGSKWPDSNATRTLAFQLHGSSSIICDASGNGSTLLVPGFNTFVAKSVTFDGTTATFGAAGSIAGTGLAPDTYRIVSWGFRFKNITQPLISSGLVRIRAYQQIVGTNLTTINTSLYTDVFDDIPLQDCKDVMVIGRKLDESFSDFVAPATTHPTGNVVNWVSPGYSAYSISIVGGPATTTAASLEFFANYELRFDDADTMQVATTPSPPENQLLKQASSYVTTNAGSIIRSGIKTVEKYIFNTAASYLSKALGNALGGPMVGMTASMATGYLGNHPIDVN